MNYGISSVEWVTALLRFNWLQNTRGNGGIAHRLTCVCTYVNVCVWKGLEKTVA